MASSVERRRGPPPPAIRDMACPLTAAPPSSHRKAARCDSFVYHPAPIAKPIRDYGSTPVSLDPLLARPSPVSRALLLSSGDAAQFHAFVSRDRLFGLQFHPRPVLTSQRSSVLLSAPSARGCGAVRLCDRSCPDPATASLYVVSSAVLGSFSRAAAPSGPVWPPVTVCALPLLLAEDVLRRSSLAVESTS